MASTVCIVCSVVFSIFFISTCEAIRCFDCNSVNNSACLDLHVSKMHAIIPTVDCSAVLPNSVSKEAFCRKIKQTLLDPEKSREVRITRGCGWVKHKRECYTADNNDHLETVCQCFGDLCNAATPLTDVKLTVLTTAIFVAFKSWWKN